MQYRTPAEEILFSVQEWYLSRGLKVPADELKICNDDITAEAATFALNDALFMKRSLEYQLECVKEEARLAKEELSYEKAADFIQRIAAYKKIIDSSGFVEPPPQVVKASYGSPEFWKEHWAKKKAAGWVPKKSPKAQK